RAPATSPTWYSNTRSAFHESATSDCGAAVATSGSSGMATPARVRSADWLGGLLLAEAAGREQLRGNGVAQHRRRAAGHHRRDGVTVQALDREVDRGTVA